ncbi:hypothetical protein LZ30DRAFT_748041 [Colletotrichum cereale]|nr:hypothetical protein LZ30DRAFT_748041 [Colletotrichum cereale]
MMFNKSLLAAIALTAHIANAEESALEVRLSQSPPRTVTGEQGCYTDFGRWWRKNVPTHSRLYSYTFTLTESTYTTPTTSTVTITPAISVGGTATITSTVTTTRHVSLFSTATVKAPARFTPIADTMAGAGLDSGYGRLESSDEAHAPQADADGSFGISLSADNDGGLASRPLLLPQVVVCEKVVRVFVTTTFTITRAATTTTILPGPTQQSTVTTTTTTTSTVNDAAASPTITTYEACQMNNMQSYHGEPRSYFVEAVHNWSVAREERRTNAPSNCCVACQETPDCRGSLYHLSSGTCYMFKTRDDGRKCQAPGKLRSAPETNTTNQYGIFWASNGRCGSWEFSNKEPGSSTER